MGYATIPLFKNKNMPQKKNSNIYAITAKYYVQQPSLIDGSLEEVEKEKEIEVLRLQRTNKAHSKIILSLISGNAYDELDTLAMNFVEACVVSAEKTDIMKDIFSCINIFENEDVQKDVVSFLEKSGMKLKGTSIPEGSK